MVFDPNANWTAAIAEAEQAPVYYLAVDGVTAEHYATAPVAAAGTTKVICLQPPRGSSVAYDLIDGKFSVGQLELELLDLDGKITDLLAIEAPGAPVPSIKNRKATLYAGYAGLDESDYAAVFTGRITAVAANRDLTGYVLELSEPLYMIAGEIMTNATDVKPAQIRGNVVNLAMSILRGVFSVSDPDFPLTVVSTDTASSSAPTGLGIPDALFDFTQIKQQRDIWHATDVGQADFEDPEDGRAYLEAEFFRIFQARPVVLGDGRIGIAFNTPPLPPAAAPVVDGDHVLGVAAWRQLLDDHLNRFTVSGDYDLASNDFLTVLHTEEDTTDQTNTEETVEYRAESRWLKTALDGAEIARELAGRMRLVYLPIPAVVSLALNFRRRNLELGDVIALTAADVPDLRAGTRGLTARLLTVIRMVPDFRNGRLEVECLDTGFRRYGVIAPDASSGDYLTASAQDRSTFHFLSSTSNQMSNGDDGYRFV